MEKTKSYKTYVYKDILWIQSGKHIQKFFKMAFEKEKR